MTQPDLTPSMAPAANRIKLHVFTTASPLLLARVAAFLSRHEIQIELGASFLKFPRGLAHNDDLAAKLKNMGFRVLTGIDAFAPEEDAAMAQRSADLLQAENAPRGHVHGPDCGHEHHHGDTGQHGHAHGHDHSHGHAHDHDHDQSHKHRHDHSHSQDHHLREPKSGS